MQQNFMHEIAYLVIILPAFLIALSFHEFAHSMAATLLGDNTSKRMGRLTLNPLAHIDPMGLMFLMIFRIGWAKPVIFDQRNFKHPRLYSILTALAGPTSNFFLALISFYLIKYLPIILLDGAISTSLIQILKATAYVNIMLGVFNILPIPPLDGSHIFIAFLSKKFPQVTSLIYRYSMLILIAIFIMPQTRMLLIQLITIAETLIKKLVI
jgi:Zn-dependent protease